VVHGAIVFQADREAKECAVKHMWKNCGSRDHLGTSDSAQRIGGDFGGGGHHG
jgi:hypothetical protein